MGNKITLIAFLSIFFIAGLCFAIKGVENLTEARDSVHWPTADGVIKVADMGTHRGSKNGTTYSADLSYDYLINGTTYSASRIHTTKYSSSDSSSARQILNQYPVGAKVRVAYNPANPYAALLEPGVSMGDFAFILFGLVFMLIPCFMGVMITRSQRNNYAAPENSSEESLFGTQENVVEVSDKFREVVGARKNSKF